MSMKGDIKMSEQNVNKIAERLESDEAFRAKYVNLKSLDEIIKTAKDDGYEISAEEVKKYLGGISKGELTDAQLALVNGGNSFVDRARWQQEIGC
jgi:predicted ribosomally synthesized peptide with nif11-like leader